MVGKQGSRLLARCRLDGKRVDTKDQPVAVATSVHSLASPTSIMPTTAAFYDEESVDPLVGNRHGRRTKRVFPRSLLASDSPPLGERKRPAITCSTRRVVPPAPPQLDQPTSSPGTVLVSPSKGSTRGVSGEGGSAGKVAVATVVTPLLQERAWSSYLQASLRGEQPTTSTTVPTSKDWDWTDVESITTAASANRGKLKDETQVGFENETTSEASSSILFFGKTVLETVLILGIVCGGLPFVDMMVQWLIGPALMVRGLYWIANTTPSPPAASSAKLQTQTPCDEQTTVPEDEKLNASIHVVSPLSSLGADLDESLDAIDPTNLDCSHAEEDDNGSENDADKGDDPSFLVHLYHRNAAWGTVCVAIGWSLILASIHRLVLTILLAGFYNWYLKHFPRDPVVVVWLSSSAAPTPAKQKEANEEPERKIEQSLLGNEDLLVRRLTYHAVSCVNESTEDTLRPLVTKQHHQV